jgi:class 3 adenylate cyclase
MPEPPGDAGAHPRNNAGPVHGTVVFVDLAGFTSLTDTHGDEEAVAVVERFETTVRNALGDPSSLIKFIGDAAMLVFDTSDQAVAVIEQIIENTAADGFPELRVGVHRGPLTWRNGEPYGATVNVASRIAAVAAGGQVLASTAAASALAKGSSGPPSEFVARGVSAPVPIVEIITKYTQSAVDPVCQMRVSRASAAATVHYADHRWDLCSLACARRFTANPDLYLAQLRRPPVPTDHPTAPQSPIG